MRHLAFATALSALTATCALPALADEIPEAAFSAGNWSGGAYTDDKGAFSYCYISVGYQNGEDLWIGLYPDDSISILLAKPGVTFEPGQKFKLQIMMETGLPYTGDGIAWDASYAGITYTDIQSIVDFLNSGRYLRILGMGIDDGFDVDGITPALGLAQDCLAQRGGVGVGGKALGTKPGGVKAPPKVPDLSKPKTGTVGNGGLGTRPGGKLGTPAPKPQP